eukprot:scaffold268429_cov13-Tisochrysis_lutea.AAC.1
MAAGMPPLSHAPQPSPAVLPPPEGVPGLMPAAPPRPLSRASLSGDINNNSIPQLPLPPQHQQAQGLTPHEQLRPGAAPERPSSRSG